MWGRTNIIITWHLNLYLLYLNEPPLFFLRKLLAAKILIVISHNTYMWPKKMLRSVIWYHTELIAVLRTTVPGIKLLTTHHIAVAETYHACLKTTTSVFLLQRGFLERAGTLTTYCRCLYCCILYPPSREKASEREVGIQSTTYSGVLYFLYLHACMHTKTNNTFLKKLGRAEPLLSLLLITVL